MTKFELAEMMGLKYDYKHCHNLWMFSYGDRSFNQDGWCENHDTEWAKESAAIEFFEYIRITLNRINP